MTEKTFIVTVSNSFEAIDHADAVKQMAAWLDDCAYQAGYRVRDMDNEVGDGIFIDAETL